MRPYLKNTQHKKQLVEWLKVKALSSNPRTEKKKKKKETTHKHTHFLFFSGVGFRASPTLSTCCVTKQHPADP
jgi:hypothetical protein